MGFPIGAILGLASGMLGKKSNSGKGAGLLGLAGSLGSSLLSNRGAFRRQKYADDRNIEFWNMQNRYNHPLAQIERLRQAGLNPNLIYGSSVAGATGSASSVAPSKAAPYAINNPVASGVQAMLATSQKNNLNATTAKTLEDAGVSNLNKKLLGRNFNSLVELQSLEVRKRAQEALKLEIENEIKDKTKADTIAQAAENLALTKENLTNTEFQNRYWKVKASLAEKGINLSDKLWLRVVGLALNAMGYNMIDFDLSGGE